MIDYQMQSLIKAFTGIATEREEQEQRAFIHMIDRARRAKYPNPRAELRALYARGFTVGQMATELRTSKRYVYRHLTRALHG